YYADGLPMNTSTGTTANAFKYTAKELSLFLGLPVYDYTARHTLPAGGNLFRTMDRECESYYSYSPYSFCIGDPVNFVDLDGNAVYLYTTRLPLATDNKFVNWMLSSATHSFIHVKSSTTDKYFAYGPKSNNVLLHMGDTPLIKQSYSQDKDAYQGKDPDRIKTVFIIDPPDGMTEEDFDKKVVEVAESFGNNEQIKYHILTGDDKVADDLHGNCNSSTYTILKKAGVSDAALEEIRNKMKGITTGFGSEKPWTAEEQAQAVKNWKEYLLELIKYSSIQFDFSF
ncbi:MAG: hypothetical protein K2H98_09380, partial [Duncaniella sp.]|nr:hypothetical protein [Duncaniella sp.]